jgi:hypothetical protein
MKTKQKLSLKIRLLIGIIAIPSLMLAAMTLSMFINQTEGNISYFEIVYSLVGVFAMYVALTGKKFF